MKTVANIICFFLALLACEVLSRTDETPAIATGSIAYVVLMFVSLGYAQWYLQRSLSPLKCMTESQRQAIRSKAKTRHRNGFFRETIGLGYLLVALRAFCLLSPEQVHDAPNFALGALFFVVIGTVAQSRAVVSVLVEELIGEQGRPNQSLQPDGRWPPHVPVSVDCPS